jgi:hypothetical protein
MTTKQTVYAARKESDVYKITQEQKDAARKRYSEQRAKRKKETERWNLNS